VTQSTKEEMGGNVTRILRSLAALAVISGGLVGVFSIAAGARSPTPAPHIVAHPHSVMVDGSTMLVGTNFKPRESITLKECSETTWIVPQDPCDSTNSIVVKVNRQGTFKNSFTVQTCPGDTSTSSGVSETCYIGDPSPSGIDVINLVGAAKIKVTGP
jgi:hypothetical protein